MSEWQEVKIGDVCQVGDGAHAKVERQVSGIPYLTSKNFGTGKLKLGDVDFISEQDYERLFAKGVKSVRRPQDGDVLMGIIGTFGNGYRYKSSDKFGVSSSVAILRPNQTKLDPDFLEYVVNSKTFSLTHQAYSSGSVQGYTNIPTIKSMPIYLPPLNEQHRIAIVLSTLDAKIDLLHRQNHTLELIAQTLFKRWFVEFEFPFDFAQGRPNEQGRPYKSSGGPMIASELGEIPEGWRVGKLGEIAKNIRATIKPEDISPDTAYIGLEHMPRRKIALDTWELAEDIGSNKYQFKKGQILFGKLRPYFHKVGVTFTDGICSTDILVLSPKKTIFFGLTLMTVSSLEFVKYVSRAAEGTRMPRTNWKYMSEYTVAIPDQCIAMKFSDSIISFVNKMEINTIQIQTLTRLRDTLLPKLMSGQIRVKP